MIEKVPRGPHLTGHCSVGAHEGVTKVSPSGKIFTSCWGFDGVCECWCHKMARDRGIPETRPVPQPSSWVLPPVTNGRETHDRGTEASPAFVPTPTGRRARGELEWAVLEVAEKFLKAQMQPTPRMISAQIPGSPSTGAVQAVLERWVDLGFALPLDRHPVALLGLTDEGKRTGLQGMKDLAAGVRRRQRGRDRRTGRRD